jgi:hypothetical protein
MPESFNEAWRKQYPADVPPPDAFEKGGLRALIGREPVVKGDPRWHISLSGPDRIPTWEELVAAAHDLRPGVVFCIPMPPRSFWVNVHPHVLHLWEVQDPHLVAEWRRNARGDRPT